jgi:hypothetical protein
MANRVQVTILEEGPRNVRVCVAGVLDTANLSAQTVLTLAQCTNNDPMANGVLKGFALQRIQYAVSSPLACVFDWHATTNQLMAAVCDSNELDLDSSGGLFPQDLNAAGWNGTVELATFGWAGILVFDCVLDFKKIYK